MNLNMNLNSKNPIRRNRASFGINIGSSSILLIFVILCLVSFATLSIVSAHADSKLSLRVLERTSNYYEACNQAEAALADIDHTLSGIYASVPDADSYFATVGQNKSYVIPINDVQTLQVTIEILYPEEDEDCFYRVDSWQVITAE